MSGKMSRTAMVPAAAGNGVGCTSDSTSSDTVEAVPSGCCTSKAIRYLASCKKYNKKYIHIIIIIFL